MDFRAETAMTPCARVFQISESTCTQKMRTLLVGTREREKQATNTLGRADGTEDRQIAHKMVENK